MGEHRKHGAQTQGKADLACDVSNPAFHHRTCGVISGGTGHNITPPRDCHFVPMDFRVVPGDRQRRLGTAYLKSARSRTSSARGRPLKPISNHARFDVPALKNPRKDGLGRNLGAPRSTATNASHKVRLRHRGRAVSGAAYSAVVLRPREPNWPAGATSPTNTSKSPI